ncbi:pentose-5-phosphate-3-epimerase [Methylorubrum zatmanii]|nr:pentose-5-phosphate-3-epimerase [Methylorubrum zatmanii]MCP1552676.1 pentose-5-phosphate-3-epimerase [Methylorubrum extorquens]MCP1581014.1 pentose-5-phosphate-3-epimerase [Methylorubrum extorquens]
MTESLRPLTDNEVHDRLVAAVEALGTRPGATVRGDTSLLAARRALSLFQLALLMAVEQESDEMPAYRPPGA